MGPIIAGLVTALAVVLAYGALAAANAPAAYRPVLARAALIALPLHPLAFYALRLPLDTALVSLIGQGGLRNWISLLYAPLTEEPMKWLVLSLPFVRRYLDPRNAVAFALAIGAGFAIGEVGLLAYQLSRIPAYAGLPATDFVPFGVERMLAAFAHGGFIAFLAARMALKGPLWPGIAASLILHFLLNLPIGLFALLPHGLSRETVALVLQGWIVAFVVVLAFAVAHIHKRLTGDKPPHP